MIVYETSLAILCNSQRAGFLFRPGYEIRHAYTVSNCLRSKLTPEQRRLCLPAE